jgi:hypothetical protein
MEVSEGYFKYSREENWETRERVHRVSDPDSKHDPAEMKISIRALKHICLVCY